jgi:hypothetical protein
MKIAARRSTGVGALPFHVAPLRGHEVARPRGEGGEGDAGVLVRLLHSGAAQVLQYHLGERPLHCVLRALGELLDQLVVLVDVEHAVRRETLDGERSRHPDLLAVDVRLVVEILDLRLRGDGGVDLLLPGNARRPPVGMKLPCDIGPLRVGLARYLPFLPQLL